MKRFSILLMSSFFIILLSSGCGKKGPLKMPQATHQNNTDQLTLT